MLRSRSSKNKPIGEALASIIFRGLGGSCENELFYTQFHVEVKPICSAFTYAERHKPNVRQQRPARHPSPSPEPSFRHLKGVVVQRIPEGWWETAFSQEGKRQEPCNKDCLTGPRESRRENTRWVSEMTSWRREPWN